MFPHRSAEPAARAWKAGCVKTRNLLILAAITGTAIIVAFTLQLMTDSRFLG